MIKRAPLLLALVFACACAGPSLRHRNEMVSLVSSGDFARAGAVLEKNKNKYGERDAVTYNLNMGTVLYDGGAPERGDINFAVAQDLNYELFTQSVSRHLGRYLINDNTVPYSAAPHEEALSYFYRAAGFLDMDNLEGALVEARRAVFFLDNLRAGKKDGYRDDPFVQYFASLLFESGGNLSSARIARANAFNAYDAAPYPVDKPDFEVPRNADQLAEIIFIHYNGFVPYKVSKTMQVAWNEVGFALSETDASYTPSSSVQNAVIGGFMGNAVTIAYPVLRDEPLKIAGSEIEIAGARQKTQLSANVAAVAKQVNEEEFLAQRARMIVRAAAKQIAAVQARHAATNISGDQNIGTLAGMVFSALNSATEVADTRSWFLLPAQIRLSRMFVPPGVYTLTFRAFDAGGRDVITRQIEIDAKKGKRIFLHERT